MFLPSFACSEKGRLSILAELSKRLATAATVATSFDFARRSNELRVIANPNREWPSWCAVATSKECYDSPNIAGHRHPPEPNEEFCWVARVAADLPLK
jgi:hypothetical protein